MVALSPSTVDAYALLGYIALALRSELPEAEAALLKASELAPGREELRLALADVMIGNGGDLAARATLTLLRNVTPSDRTREVIDSRAELPAGPHRRGTGQARYRGRSTPSRGRSRIDDCFATSGIGKPGGPGAERRTQSPANPPSSDPAVLRATPRVSGSRLDGFLTQMDCTKELTVHVRTDAGPALFHTDTPSNINFVWSSAKAPKLLSCGPVVPEQHVVVVYGAGPDPSIRGELLVMEVTP